jgi:hypothetical protein
MFLPGHRSEALVAERGLDQRPLGDQVAPERIAAIGAREVLAALLAARAELGA